MKDLSKLAEKLNEKQSWVRKGLQNLMDEWADVTANINDSKLINVILWWQDKEPHEVYFITTGYSDINFIRADAFNSLSDKEIYDSSGYINMDKCDFNIIREVIKELPKSFAEFEKRIGNAIRETDKWNEFLSKFRGNNESI